MKALKLIALDSEDLDIVSAHVQDAVLKTGDIKWMPKQQRFLVAMNRFAWEKAARTGKNGFERRRAVLHFDRVRRAQSHNLKPADKDEVLALLAVRFSAAEEPEGTVELAFAGGGTIRLEVECLEAQLSDLGAAWETKSKPQHETDETDGSTDS
ncbi:hypothetical protein GGD81_004078 [Rhodobium orientis]|uniref:DUF2948 domain-containing protein n=1 Tax=Rhodobium orientis TaxID=34017 RepID=A0A327JJ83_9HYPH|nr:DUF2948 family protein [Rhodobium orientis]MBB4305012.1 hypothetical protein [Rhodobium orientis]MBK5948781.1 hypothetical protein [Rhodobium orientis]RAI26477.1 hypothetical protein CH339_14085 [Rhodobium orientis]